MTHRPRIAAITRIPLQKRCLDLALLLFLIPVLVPVMLCIAAFIKLVSRGPVFHRQQRVGFQERPFELIKFRSMRLNAESAPHQQHTAYLLKNNLPLRKLDANADPRLIPLGRLLRASGLDELPQVINVIRGEMSLVGPRPCMNYEFELLDLSSRARFQVLPGITGLWQVSGKNRTTFRQMIELDLAYARQSSAAMDLRILLRTVPVLCGQVAELCTRRPPAPNDADLSLHASIDQSK